MHDVCHTFVDDGIGIVALSLVDGPIGIERHADDVPFRSAGLQNAKVPVVELTVETVVKMYDDLCLRTDALYGFISGFEDFGISPCAACEVCR